MQTFDTYIINMQSLEDPTEIISKKKPTFFCQSRNYFKSLESQTK